MLVGRERERAAIDALVDGARRAAGGALVLRGVAGIGKTALLREVVGSADDVTLIRADGVEAEHDIELAGLHQLCLPLAGLLDRLRPHQAAILRVALGLDPPGPADRFAVGAALLALLSEAADEQPVVALVDDVHWLDRSTVDALCFAGRRIAHDRIALLLATRPEGAAHDALARSGFDVLELAPLPRGAAEELLHAQAPRIAESVAEQLMAAAAGLPLGIVELTGRLDPAQLDGTAPLDEPLQAGERIERLYASRLAALPERGAAALLLLAVAGGAGETALDAALAASELTRDDFDAAERAGLVRRVGPLAVEAVHPTLLAAAYAAAQPDERRRAHRAMAEALRGTAEVERRAAHLSASVTGPDAEAARVLEEAGRASASRGGHAAAAALLERAGRAHPAESDAVRCLAAAASSAWRIGDQERATALCDEVASRASGAERAWALQLRGVVEWQTGSHEEATRMIVAAAEELRAEDPIAAATMLVDAATPHLFVASPHEALRLVREARTLLPRDGSAVDLSADFTLGRALVMAGEGDEGRPALERVADAYASADDPAAWMLANAAIFFAMTERDDDARQAIGRGIDVARRTGPIATIGVLGTAAHLHTRSGDWDDALRFASEAEALARELGHQSGLVHALADVSLVHAARGRRGEVAAALVEALDLARRGSVALMEEMLTCVRGLDAMGAGEWDAAVEVLAPTAERLLELGVHDRDLAPEPDLVEALVRLGRLDEARYWAEVFADRGPRMSPSWGTALAGRCRGLLAADDAFAVCFDEALVHHGRVRDAWQEARTLVAYGERLRRTGERVAARERLREALRGFEALGAEPWAERTRRELRASGETLRRSTAAAGDELTPQELQVALEVAQGKSNKEVGASLFLSPKTVEFHLSRIYRKLGVASRAELVRRFATEGA